MLFSVIEVVHMKSEYTAILSSHIDNGKCNRKGSIASIMATSNPDEGMDSVYGDTTQPADDVSYEFATSFATQFTVLIKRMFLQMSRNRTMIWIQIIHHLISAGLLGSIFFGIGNDADMVVSNFNFCLSVMVFFVYTHVMVPVLLCK